MATPSPTDTRTPRAYGLVPAARDITRPPTRSRATATSTTPRSRRRRGPIAARAVAILDVDFHHGNGTQQIFYDRDDVLFVSLHADPADDYPYFLGFASERGWGAGEGYNRNFPLPPGTDWDAYAPALDARDRRRSASSRPMALVVSLGVDTAAEDPDRFQLVADDYPRIGAAIARARAPDGVLQEGGYALDVLGRNVVNVLREVDELERTSLAERLARIVKIGANTISIGIDLALPVVTRSISSARAPAGHGAHELEPRGRDRRDGLARAGDRLTGSVTMRSAGKLEGSARVVQNSNAIATASQSRPPGAPSAWRMSCSWVTASKRA